MVSCKEIWIRLGICHLLAGVGRVHRVLGGRVFGDLCLSLYEKATGVHHIFNCGDSSTARHTLFERGKGALALGR